ncbi:alpha-L-fucosidase [Aureibaculum luteum]|uniref:alpha-L-fucosidase n=1 Tax=Aureibaculum luteum TaxID=1548456 RepID=UPI000E511E3F|nr:alpha-L-fucosidase [Aureibaculum luteum]
MNYKIKQLIVLILLVITITNCNKKKEKLVVKDNSSLGFDFSEIESDPKVLDKLEAFQDKKFGFFVHWGIYSQWGAVASWPLIKKFEGTRTYGPAFADRDYDFNRYFKDYYNLNKTFNPEKFDPEQWANVAESAGMKYFVFVTKHHDGFNMFDTEQSDFSITGPDSPFKTNKNANIAKVLFDAFRAKKFSVGAYFSKPDWHNENYWAPEFPTPDHSVNYDPREYPEKWDSFKNFTYNQIEELVTDYGKIDMLWLDGAQVLPVANQDIDLDRIVKMVREKQPGIIVVDRLAGGKHENYLSPEGLHNLPEKPLSKPWELCMSLGEGWSHRVNDVFKSSKEIIDILIEVVSKGGNLLLDVGPPASGEIPEAAIKSMKEIGDWLSVNGEAIYKTRRFTYFQENDKVRYTQSKNGKTIYVLSSDWPENELKLTKVIPNKSSKIFLLGSDKELKWVCKDDKLTIKIPNELKKELNQATMQAFAFRIEGSPIMMVKEPTITSLNKENKSTYMFNDTYTFEIKSGTPEAKIYYTLDGSIPSENSLLYNEKITIKTNTLVNAIAKCKGFADSPIFVQNIKKVKSFEKISVLSKANNIDAYAKVKTLSNLKRGSLNHKSQEWLKFEKNNLIATVDLGKTEPINKISVGFLKNVYESIFVPDSVKISISNDGDIFKVIGNLKYNISPFEMKVYVKDYVLDSINRSTRFVKIEAENMGVCPHPHFNSGGNAWLYADEIIIE